MASAVVVEDGTGKSDAMSYASTDYVTVYAAARNLTSWASLLQSQQDACVIMASDYLDTTQMWSGNRNSLSQGLQWPRSGAYDKASQLDIPNNYIPAELLRAVAELAIKAAAGTTLVQDLTRDNSVKSESVSGLSITYMDNAPAATIYGAISLLKGIVRDDDELPPQISIGTPGRPGFYQGMFDIPGGGDRLKGGFISGPGYDDTF